MAATCALHPAGSGKTRECARSVFGRGTADSVLFKAGQFVTWSLQIDGEQIMRSYSISSSPSVPYSFSIYGKAHYPAGKGCPKTGSHDNLVEGLSLRCTDDWRLSIAIDLPHENILMLPVRVGINAGDWSIGALGFSIPMPMLTPALSNSRPPPQDLSTVASSTTCAHGIGRFNVLSYCDRQGRPGQPGSAIGAI